MLFFLELIVSKMSENDEICCCSCLGNRDTIGVQSLKTTADEPLNP